MIKILFLIDKLAPAGTQQNLLEIVRGLDRKRFEPYVISLSEGGALVSEFQAAGTAPIILKVRRAYGFSGIKAVIWLARFLRKERIDVIQLHFLKAMMIGTAAAKMARVKSIITVRRDEGFWVSRRQRQLHRWLNRYADIMLVNSEAVKRAVMTAERPALPVEVIWNGVRIEPGTGSRASGYGNQETGTRGAGQVATVGVVANMRHAIKGYEDLIAAIPEVLKQCPGTEFVFAGDGDLRPKYEARAGQLGVRSSIEFLGVRSDIPQILSLFDICCLASWTEGFSNSLLEYMAAGKPVVATNVGGNPEIVADGVTGFLVPPKNPGALAEKLILLVRDPTLRLRMGQAGRERVRREFSLKRMIERYEEFYTRYGEGDTGNETRDTRHETRERGTGNETRGTRQEIRARSSDHAPCPVAHAPRKILYIIWSLDLGGAEQVVMNLAKNLDREKFLPAVCCLNEKGRYAAVLENLGIKVEALRKWPGFDPFLIPRLVSLIRREKPDLIHTHLFTGNLWGRLAAFFTGTPVVSTEHNQDFWKKGLHWMLDRRLQKVNCRVIFVSEKVAEFYREKIPQLEKKGLVIYNGIETGRFEAGRDTVRATHAIPAGAKVIGSAGRLVPQKGLDVLIDAVRELHRDGLSPHLILAGDGPERAVLEEKTRAAGLSHFVHFTGFSPDTAGIYPGMDVFALASWHEGFPLVLLEAMAAGTAVVATRVGGVAECITDGEDGLLVEPRDTRGLAQALKRVLEDAELRRSLTQKARKKVAGHFSVETMTRNHEALYNDVLEERAV